MIVQESIDGSLVRVENVGVCPVCESAGRNLLHRDLADHTFCCAPGNWTMWRCVNCGSAYLDPRPDEGSVQYLYGNYYTHNSRAAPSSNNVNTIAGNLRRKIRNGYTNWRFGTTRLPASKLGILAVPLLCQKWRVDRKYRHIPRLGAAGARLLDVGCGNGSFLQIVNAVGWVSEGVDIDPASVAVCKQAGLDVKLGDIGLYASQEKKFDVITLSHVLEHVHHPRRVLQSASDLLVDGGLLWLETPNIDSLGHDRFRGGWRGLEVPRHLTLFNLGSLRSLLHKCGFVNIEFHFCPAVTGAVFDASDYTAVEKDFPKGSAPDVMDRLHVYWADLISRFCPRKREFITLTAQRKHRKFF